MDRRWTMTHLKPEECLRFFSEVLSILKATHEPERVLSLIVDRIVRMFNCQSCAVIQINPETELLRILTNHNLSHLFVKNFHSTLGTGAIAKMLSTGRTIIIADSESEPQLAQEIKLEHPFRSAICLQISAEHRTLGYLFADSRDPNTFTEHDLGALQSFADLVSITLNKAYLYEKNLRLDPIDSETGLEKYAPFLERLSESISHANEHNESLSLFILDIDNYKQIGGTYGYDASKCILKEVAGIVKRHLRAVDDASRYGFDEIIISRENSTLEDGLAFADNLRKIIESTEFTPQKIHTTVSIGVATFPQHAKTEKDILLVAKEALYEAQRTGRNRVAQA